MKNENISIKFFWNIENTMFKNYDFLEKKFYESIHRTKEEDLKNYFLDCWFEKIFKHLTDFKFQFKSFFENKTYVYDSYYDLFDQLLLERIKFQEYSSKIRNETFNDSLIEHIVLFWKLFFYSLKEWKINLSDEDVINFVIKIVFHDFWRVFSHEEYFHQDLEEYLWLYNSDSFWKKLEWTYDDILNEENFKKLSKYSFFYSLLDIVSKKDISNMYKYFNFWKEEKILDILNNNYFLSIILSNNIEDLRWFSKEEYLKWLYMKYILIELVNRWFNTLWEFEEFVKNWFHFNM